MVLIEVRHGETGELGWGRDREEARSHAGFGSVPSAAEEFREVVVFDDPEPGDSYSGYVCHELCDHFLSEDFRNNLDEHNRVCGTNISLKTLDAIQMKIDQRLFGSAIVDLTNYVFDDRNDD